MLVISQDRDKIIKVDNCDLIIHRDHDIVAFNPTFPAKYYHGEDSEMEHYITIGHFVETEKVKKVFQKMLYALSSFEEVFSIPSEDDEKFFEEGSNRNETD